MNTPKGNTEMTEWKKREAGEPFDSAKLFQEMDDAQMDASIEAIVEHNARKRAQGIQPPKN